MLFRRTHGRNGLSSEVTALLDALPSVVHPIALAALYRDAVDHILLTAPETTPFLHARYASEGQSSTTLFSRNPDAPLFRAPDRPLPAVSNLRLQALLEALASTNLRADLEQHTSLDISASGTWVTHREQFVLGKHASLGVNALTGTGLSIDGELAPLMWRGHFAGPVDYTGAQVDLVTKAGTVSLRLGERAGSTAAVVKAINVSERRRGSNIDFYATARALESVPHAITGPTAELLRGIAPVDRPLLTALDVTVSEDHLAAARTAILGLAVKLNPVSSAAFNEIQALSTSHQTQLGTVVVGSVTTQLLTFTHAVSSPRLTA